MKNIRNITRIAGNIISWFEGDVLFTVTRNTSGLPTSISAFQGTWESQKAVFTYDVLGNFTGMTGDVDTQMLPRILAEATGVASFSTDANNNTVLLGADGIEYPVKGSRSVLLRFINSEFFTAGRVGEGAIEQTITKAASGAGTPYNFLKWGELVYDETGETLAQYPANLDRIIVPAGVTMARVSASFALNPASSSVVNVTGAANNGAGLIRLTVSSVTGLFASGCSVTVASVGGTTEANGAWQILVIDATHIDLVGSTFTNAWTSGGTVSGSLGTYRGLRIYGGAAGTTNFGNTKLFSFHATQSNNMSTMVPHWFPTTPGDILRIGLLQDTAADWVNPVGDAASSYFSAEFR